MRNKYLVTLSPRLAKDKPEVVKTIDKEYNEEDTSDSDTFIKIRSGLY